MKKINIGEHIKTMKIQREREAAGEAERTRGSRRGSERDEVIVLKNRASSERILIYAAAV